MAGTVADCTVTVHSVKVRELPEVDDFSPRTFDPDDAMSNPESPLDRLTLEVVPSA